MKKILLVLCCLTLALASCNKDEPETPTNPEPPVTPETPCDAPYNLSHSVNEFDVTLFWSGTSEMYKLYCNDSLIASEITDTTYLDVVPDYGTYIYKVKGICGDVESDFSEPDNVMITEEFHCLAPENLVFQVNDNDVTLSWTGYSNLYIIYRNNDSLTEVTETSYSDMDLEPGSYIYWIVGKCDDLGGLLSLSSDTVVVEIVEVIVPCDAPTDFSAVVTEQNDVLLSWQGDAESYSIYRDDSQIVTGITDLSYTDYAPGFGTFIYKVKAACGDQESPFSDEASVEIIEPIEDPMLGDYQGDVYLIGTISILGQFFPYSDTIPDVQMTLNKGEDLNTLNVTMTYNGSTSHVVATVDGNNITIPDQSIENIIIPFNYNGMTINIEMDMLISNIVGVFNSDNETILLTADVTGSGIAEIPIIGQQPVQINLRLSGIFNKMRF